MQSNNNKNLKVVLVDDHRLFRDGLSAVLALHGGIEVVAGVGTAVEALAAVEEHRPDIVLLDIHLGSDSGLECIEPIRLLSPATRIVLLTADESDATLRRGIQQQVDGYLLKTLPARQLVDALREVLAGELVLPTANRPAVAAGPALTPREREILHLLALGKSNPQVAILLAISENTVKVHVRNLMEKFGVHNRVLLVGAALKQGFCPSD